MKSLHEDIEPNNIEKHLANPLNAFKLIKRSTADLHSIVQQIKKRSNLFTQNVEKLAQESDLLGAVEGILRLQKFYKLKTHDLERGVIDGLETEAKLSGDELFLIGLKAHTLKEESFAQEYLKMSLERSRKHASENIVLFALADSYRVSEGYQSAIATLEKILENDPTAVVAALQKQKLESILDQGGSKSPQQPAESFDHNGDYHIDKEEILFRKACRGKMIKSTKESSRLGCRYQATNYFTMLALLKAEEINSDTKVIMFHGVITDKEIDHLKENSQRKIIRASTFINEQKITNQRIAQVAWHSDEDRIVKRISKRIEDMTGLSMKSAEDLQVQNYGIGGHYFLHWDHRLKNQPQFDLGTGNRFATVLFYVSLNGIPISNVGSNVFSRCLTSKKVEQPSFHISTSTCPQ